MRQVALYVSMSLWMVFCSGFLFASDRMSPRNKEIDIHHSAYKYLTEAKEYTFHNNRLLLSGFAENKKTIVANNKHIITCIRQSAQLLSLMLTKLNSVETQNAGQSKKLRCIIQKYENARARLLQLPVMNIDDFQKINATQAKDIFQSCEQGLNGICSLLNQAQAKYYIFQKRQITIANK